MKAPAAQSVEVAYREEWNFVNASGSIINVNASPVVWVQIKVPTDGGNSGGGDIRKIKITNPEKGDDWESNEEHTIRWDSDNISKNDHVRISFSMDNGKTWYLVPDADSTRNDGSKKWYFGDDNRICKDTDDARIRIECIEHPEVVAISERFRLNHKRGYPNCD